jgi:uncharacterized membrane protein YedE/YeeE
LKPALSALAAGLLFGIGLMVSGMTQADKVINFLNPFGDWDPSLGFVMIGALAVHVVARRVTLRRNAPLLEPHFLVPTRRDISPRLVLGSSLFGIGWALGGYCPGPGLVSVASGATPAVVFMGGTTLGMILVHAWDARRTADARRAHAPADGVADELRPAHVHAGGGTA